MAPGSEPDRVIELARILEPHVYGTTICFWLCRVKPISIILYVLHDLYKGMALAGAGGGGFLYAITKEAESKSMIQKLLDESNLGMCLYNASISSEGIEFNFV